MAARALPNILTALNDPKLFEPSFRGESWSGWKVVLKAAYGLALTADETVFFKSIAGDREPPTEPCRELWCIVGRGGGKDSVASVIAAFSAATFAGQKHLRPGERTAVVCLACDRDQSRIVLNYTRSYFHDIPMLAALNGRNVAGDFELKNGVDVAVATNSFRSMRGRSIVCAILDECAFWRSEDSSRPDQEVYDALLPALARVPGSMLIWISSPYRKSGLLHAKFKRHYGEPGDILVIKAPTRVLNPTIPQEVVDRALADDFAKASAEWMAEFRSDISGYLDFEVIEAAVDRDVIVRAPLKQFTYQSFCDPSGGARDSFTAAITHVENDIVIQDAMIEVKSPFNPSEAVATIAKVLLEYGVRETTGDRYAAQWVVDAFARCGIRYRHSERDRSAIYGDAMPLFTSGKIRLLDHRKMVTQFANLERRTSPIGKDRIDHGPSGHDDLCNSVAGAAVLSASPIFEPPQPFFGTYSRAVGNSSEFGVFGSNGPPDRYSDSPADFWKMMATISERR